MNIIQTLNEALAAGHTVEIDLDMGALTFTPEEALELWDQMAPGEGFEIIAINNKPVPTRYIYTLTDEEQKVISDRLTKAGITGRAHNDAMDGRLCDIAEIIA